MKINTKIIRHYLQENGWDLENHHIKLNDPDSDKCMHVFSQV